MAERTSVGRTGFGRAGGGLSNVLLLASVRRPDLRRPDLRQPDLRRRGNAFYAALVLRLAGVGLLAWIGWVHWILWQNEGYKSIPTDGPFFLIDAIAGVALAVLLLAWPRPLAGLLSAGFTASTILALVISLWVGLFGFKEFISAHYVVLALVIESIALVILLAWTVFAAWALPARR